MARGKKVDIDKQVFENLCGIQCTKKEVCSVLGCSHDTVERFCKKTYKMTFEEAREVFSEGGKASLRRTQFMLAEKNPAMAIFLGKQYLNQRDSYEVVDNTPIEKLDAILGSLREAATDGQAVNVTAKKVKIVDK